jgi:DNA-binding MarR family transcriptional regulator
MNWRPTLHPLGAPAGDEIAPAAAIAGPARSALDLWRGITAQTLRVHGPELTARQTAILLTIYLDPGPHTVRGLAAGLGLGKPAVVRALDAMAADGLVRRVPDPADRRSVFLERTAQGAERLASFAGAIAAEAARAAEALAASPQAGLGTGAGSGSGSGPGPGPDAGDGLARAAG